MSIQSQNAAGGLFESYAADAAVSLMFGVGYFLFQKFKPNKKDNLKAPGENEINLNFLKGKSQDSIGRWETAKSVEEINHYIQSDYDGTEDPFVIISFMNRRGVMPNIETFNSMLHKCFLSGNNEGIDSIKNEIFDYMTPFHANLSTLNILIKGLGIKYLKNLNQENITKNLGNFETFKKFDEELMELIQNMENKFIYMDVNCQNSILEALVNMKRLNEAWNQYVNMKKLFIPNSLTFEIILKGLKQSGDINEYNLEILFQIIEEANSLYELDKESFDWLIESCLKINLVDKADDYFTIRKAKNLEISENTYGKMIEAYGKILQLDKAYALFENIKSKSISYKLPSPQLYCCIINACVKCGNIILAENIIEEMTLNKIDKILFIYTSMIVGYKNAKFYNRAIELYDYLLATKSNQINFDIFFYNTILECCVEGQKFQKMEEIHNYITTRKYPELDLTTLIILLKGYAINYSSDKVKEIYGIINSSQYHSFIDETIYELILECYEKNNDEINLTKIFSEMKSNKIIISLFTYETMIKTYCKRGNFNKAFELFDECVKSGNKPTINIYKMLIQLQIKSTLIDRAITLFRNMIINQLKPDSNLYKTIIEACYNYKRFKEAAEFIANAAKDGIKMDDSLYIKLIESIEINDEEFKIADKYDTINKFLTYVRQFNINLDESNLTKFNCFIGSYHRNYLNKNKSYKYNYKNIREMCNLECEEISIYEYAEICLDNKQKLNYSKNNGSDMVNSYSNYNKQRHFGKHYNGRNNYNTNYEEEKSIYC